MNLTSPPRESFLEFLCHLFDKREVEERRKILQIRSALFEKRRMGDEEFCNGCFALMGFPKKRSADDPIRFERGASYDVAGQFCSACNRKKLS